MANSCHSFIFLVSVGNLHRQDGQSSIALFHPQNISKSGTSIEAIGEFHRSAQEIVTPPTRVSSIAGGAWCGNALALRTDHGKSYTNPGENGME